MTCTIDKPLSIPAGEAVDKLLHGREDLPLCQTFRQRVEEILVKRAADLIELAEYGQLALCGQHGENIARDLLDLAREMDLPRKMAAMER